MDETSSDIIIITTPVPVVDVEAEARNKALQASNITHFVIQLSYKRFDLLMQTIAGVSYDYDNPWPFWFFIGKMVSKAFFDDESRLEWLNAVQVLNKEFIAFSNTKIPNQDKPENKKSGVRVIEVDFLKPQPGKNIKLFWKPARSRICKSVQHWIDHDFGSKCDGSGPGGGSFPETANTARNCTAA